MVRHRSVVARRDSLPHRQGVPGATLSGGRSWQGRRGEAHLPTTRCKVLGICSAMGRSECSPRHSMNHGDLESVLCRVEACTNDRRRGSRRRMMGQPWDRRDS